MLDIVARIISQLFEVLAFSDISFVVALGVVLVALGFLGNLAKPSQKHEISR